MRTARAAGESKNVSRRFRNPRPRGATALLATIGGHQLGVLPSLLSLLAGCLALVSVRWLLDQSIRIGARRAAALWPWASRAPRP